MPYYFGALAMHLLYYQPIYKKYTWVFRESNRGVSHKL